MRLVRNPLTWLRTVGWVGSMVAALLLRPTLSHLGASQRMTFVIGFSLGTVWACYGELLGAIFSAEGHNLGLYLVTGVSPGRLLLGKLLGVSPFALLSMVGGWVATVATGGAWTDGRGALLGLALGLGMLLILVGGAAAGARLQTEAASDTSEAMAMIWEQVPGDMGGWIGLTGSLAYAVGATWLISRGLLPFYLLMLLFFCGVAVSIIISFFSLRSLLRRGEG